MALVIFFTFLIFISWVLYILTRKRKSLCDFPAPPGQFLFGHILQVGSSTRILKACSRYINEYGSTVNLKAGPYYDVLLTSDYNLTQFILTRNKGLKKSENYYFLKPWLGSGLLISEGLEWKKSRKMLTPTFHFEILKNYILVFESVGDVFVNKLRNCVGRDCVDLCPLVKLCTLDAICETAMGTKINAQNGENAKYVESVKEISRIVIDRTFSLLKLKDWSFLFTSDYYLQSKLLKNLHNFTLKVISDKKEELNRGEIFEEKKKVGFLDLLLNYQNDGEKLSENKIREEVDTFMFEGHDTTASAISFTLFCLAKHPNIQERVFEEQIDLFGKEKNPKITYQDLQDMKYLENVIKESLRLYPPVPVIGRFTTEDLQFEEHLINKNTNFVLFIYGMHRNPDYFPNPETFNPDRFNSTDGSSPYAYIPFSAGPRNCIGQKFAILEIKSIISKVVRYFKVKPAMPEHELKLAVEIVLTSINGVKVQLEERV